MMFPIQGGWWVKPVPCAYKGEEGQPLLVLCLIAPNHQAWCFRMRLSIIERLTETGFILSF